MVSWWNFIKNGKCEKTGIFGKLGVRPKVKHVLVEREGVLKFSKVWVIVGIGVVY